MEIDAHTNGGVSLALLSQGSLQVPLQPLLLLLQVTQLLGDLLDTPAQFLVLSVLAEVFRLQLSQEGCLFGQGGLIIFRALEVEKRRNGLVLPTDRETGDPLHMVELGGKRGR